MTVHRRAGAGHYDGILAFVVDQAALGEQFAALPGKLERTGEATGSGLRFVHREAAR